MPEGHSIHHFKRIHSDYFVNRTVAVSSPQGRFSDEASKIDGTTLEKITAYGKHLFFHFENDKIVHVHLGLYGWFNFCDVDDDDAMEHRQESIRMQLQTDWIVSRLRGPITCELIDHCEVEKIIDKLGPDPILEDSDQERAWNKISTRKKPIASLLMDQSIIAGIGNVYRAELLFMARIYPYTYGTNMLKDDFDHLWRLSKRYMKLGSFDGYIQTLDQRLVEDSNQSTWVYGRQRLQCFVCKYPVTATMVDGRKLYWCPECQI